MSYSVEGGATQGEIGTAETSRYQNIYGQHSLFHHFAAVTVVRTHNISDQNVSFSHTESTFTDIQGDYGCIKQKLYFGHH